MLLIKLNKVHSREIVQAKGNRLKIEKTDAKAIRELYMYSNDTFLHRDVWKQTTKQEELDKVDWLMHLILIGGDNVFFDAR